MDEQRPITVAIADDSEDIRSLIRLRLERDGRFEIVGEAENAAAGTELVRQHRPDIATFDLHMEGMEELAFLGDARSASPRTAIVIVTGTYHPDRDPDLDLAEITAWFTKDQIMGEFPDRLLDLVRQS